MLKKLSIVLMAGIAGLMINRALFAESPDVVMVFTPSSETGATLLYAGNDNAPPPIVVVRGEIVGGSSHENGGLDCAKTENRPVCQTLQFVNDIDACDGPPDFIVIWPDGHEAQILCSGNDNSPPPVVIVNGEVVLGP